MAVKKKPAKPKVNTRYQRLYDAIADYTRDMKSLSAVSAVIDVMRNVYAERVNLTKGMR